MLITGLEILVDAKSYGIFELRVAYVKVSSSSCEPVGVRCDHDSCNSLLATPTLSYFKSGNANYFHRLVAWSSLRFSREVLHRHTGRKRIALAHVLGDHVLNALMCKSFYINTVSDLTRAGRGFSTEKSSLNLAILDSPCCILRPPACISAIVVWADTICRCRCMERSFFSSGYSTDCSRRLLKKGYGCALGSSCVTFYLVV